MDSEQEIELDVADLQTILQTIADGMKDIADRLERIEGLVVSDHEKIVEIESHSQEDHKKLEDLERTGRITVRPLGI
ncbi:MAG: hypothetical protein AAF591_18085 [Verrucomicrobiota bacterium]